MFEKLELQRAAKLFRSFFKREPKPSELVSVGPCPRELGLVVGEVVGIAYKATIDRKPFFHRFNKNARPLLVVSSDGTQAYILKGGYRFTDRGFIG